MKKIFFLFAFSFAVTACSSLALAQEKDPFDTYLKGGDRAAELVRLEPPDIPKSFKLPKKEISVSVKVQVDATGRPVKAEFVKGDKALKAAAIESALLSGYAPAVQGDSSVISWITISIPFTKTKAQLPPEHIKPPALDIPELKQEPKTGGKK